MRPDPALSSWRTTLAAIACRMLVGLFRDERLASVASATTEHRDVEVLFSHKSAMHGRMA